MIEDNSIDMILSDLPYGTTRCSWDSIIPFDKLWKQYKRIIKDNGMIVLTASQPFTCALIMSNRKMFRYCLVWDKIRGSNFALANKQPLKTHEDICIFYKKQGTYNPQMMEGKPYDKTKYDGDIDKSNITEHCIKRIRKKNNGKRFPVSTLKFSMNWRRQDQLHPTQKPLELFEYLIKTYSNEGDIVLDNCMGSGTTAIACKRRNRHFIGFEINEEYYDISMKRLLNVPERLEKWIDSY